MTTKENSSSKAVAASAPAGSMAMPFDFGEMAGEGMENMTAADQAVPFIRILQALSPEVAKKDSKIPGAEPGLMLDTVTRELHESIVIVPCITEHLYVEWRPRSQGGGFVGRRGLHDAVIPQCRKNEKGRLITPDGHELVETFYLACMTLASADDTVPAGFAMLAFTSSGIQPYKKSIGELRKFPGAPLFAHRLRVSTDEQSNSEGTWYNWVLRPVNQPDGDPVFRNGVLSSLINPSGPQAALLDAARNFKSDVMAGSANISYDSQDGASSGEGEDAPF